MGQLRLSGGICDCFNRLLELYIDLVSKRYGCILKGGNDFDSTNEKQCVMSSTYLPTLTVSWAYQHFKFEKTQNIKVVDLYFSYPTKLDSCNLEF